MLSEHNRRVQEARVRTGEIINLALYNADSGGKAGGAAATGAAGQIGGGDSRPGIGSQLRGLKKTKVAK